jgi:ParB-like chromosome segregation protein Spo0J
MGINRNILTDVNIAELQPYKNNPRKNDKSVSCVVESIKEFGYGNPIIVDENMEVIAGHTRLKAIKKLGWTTLPEVVKIAGLTEV